MSAAPLLYLASPYTHSDPAVRQARFEAVCRAAWKLMHAGQCVYSPIAHGHAIEILCAGGVTLSHEFWLQQCFPILSRSSRFGILMLEGWDRSRGIAAEVAFAVEHAIPIEHVDP